MERRQRARSHLVALRAKHGTDEVRLAEAALSLAKVNKATHVLNVHARRAVRMARVVAAKKIHFARTMLASRLKAIMSTQHLASDKAQLRARAHIAEAQEVLFHAKQQVLMALDGTDARLRLEEIVGADAVADVPTEVVQEGQSSGTGAMQKSAVQEFDGEISMGATGATLRDEELLGQHAAALSHAPLDTIYTAKMHRCTFPFKYNGEKFYSCKNSVHGHWCATKVDATARVTEWDYCVLDKRVVGLAKQAAMEAAKLEITRMLHNTGAHIGAGALRESLRAAAAAQQQHKPAAGKTASHPSAEPKASPVMGAKDAAAKVDQMINAGGTTEEPHYDVERRMAELTTRGEPAATIGKGEARHMRDEAAEAEADEEGIDSPQEFVEEMEEEKEGA